MSRTAILRRQHDAAENLVAEVLDALRELPSDKDCAAIRSKLAKLKGLLLIHLAQEDRYLYPAMMNSDDPRTSTLARAFQREMGDLGQQFSDYMDRWLTPAAIKGSLDQFVAETQHILGALGNRIARENRQLYPLADQLDTRSFGERQRAAQG